MAIVATFQAGQIEIVSQGQGPSIGTLSVTGLVPASSNTVPHGLPRTPRRVWFTSLWSANATTPTLDNSQGGGVGYDATNIYFFVPAAVTTTLVHVEY